MLQAPDFSNQLVTQQAVIATVVTAQAVREGPGFLEYIGLLEELVEWSIKDCLVGLSPN